jgi:hypothetical protein
MQKENEKANKPSNMEKVSKFFGACFCCCKRKDRKKLTVQDFVELNKNLEKHLESQAKEAEALRKTLSQHDLDLVNKLLAMSDEDLAVKSGGSNKPK